MKMLNYPNQRLRHEDDGVRGFRNNQRLRELGGQYAAPIGTSTKDKTDRERDAEALADFNAAWEEIRYGVVCGRKW